LQGVGISEPQKDQHRMVKLYSLTRSGYRHMARIVGLDKGLTDRIALVPVRTQGVDNPLYAINPTGRVPALVLDDGTVLEDSPPCFPSCPWSWGRSCAKSTSH